MREFIEGTTVSPKYDLRVGATEHEVQTIIGLIKKYNIHNFVEVGIHEGGLTEILLSETHCNYLGIEINEQIVSPFVKKEAQDKNFRIIYADCMLSYTLENVADFLFINTGADIVYCDNGNKKEEIKIYADIVEFGSILLTHDFSDGIRKVRDIENYNYPEVTLDDVKFLDNNLSFQRLPEELLKETRLVGWMRIN